MMLVKQLKTKDDFIALYRWGICFIVMTANAITTMLIYVLSLGLLWRFNYKYVTPLFCRLAFFLVGSKVILPKAENFSKKQVVYVFNHNSLLDIFLIPLLGIPNCRYMTSSKTKKILPLKMVNISNGAFFIPEQHEHIDRVEFLKDMSLWLKNNDQSIVCSAEGVHYFDHYIAKFNKGIFHMAMESGLDIQPLFFNMKKGEYPMEDVYFKKGTYSVDFLEPVKTNSWKIENIDEEVKKIRQSYVEHFNKVHSENIS